MVQTIRPYLELIYFITGGPLLALFALLALRQISVAKRSSQLACRREALRLASEQVHHYAEDIVPAINELNDLIKVNDADILFDGEVVVESDSIRVKRSSSGKGADMYKKFETILPAFAVVINRLEAFSIFFVSGVASEKVAYSSVGPTFVRTVKRLMPLIIVQTTKGKNYENLSKLFILWHNRLEKDRLEEESANIRDKLTSLKDRKITPVGS